MDFKILPVRLLFFLILIFSTTNTFSQCFEIQSILVDACGGADEGRNEMVRFKVGNTPLDINNLIVDWPNNSWQGVIQNTVTASKVAQLNADILIAGGCAQILEPPGGILPANAEVILITSFNMNTAVHSFGAISKNLYMIFQNNATNSIGHFANYGPAPGARTYSITFGGTCSSSVVYDRTLLTTVTGNNAPADGATVNFTPAGVASYTNSGCVAPTPPFSVDAGASSITVCAGTTINLNGSAEGQQSLNWTAVSGNFSSPTTTTTDYEVPLSAGGTTIVLTLEAVNACGVKITDTVNLIVTPSTTPDFETVLALCSTDIPPILASTSPNGITGTWNPPTISTTASGNYIFTPTAGQCASSAALDVNITSFSFSVKQGCIDNNYLVEIVLNSTLPSSDHTIKWINDKGDQIAYNTLLFNYTKYLETLTDKANPPLQFDIIVGLNSCEVKQTFVITDTLCGIQNVVSPNGDGKNDDFDLTPLKISSLTIFNRYGTEVYHFRGRYDTQWHGQWKNGLLPTGTYYYILSNEDGEERVGWVFLSY